MASDFSVIICAYTEKRWKELLTAVESVQNQTLLPREIIVVIDRNPGLLAKVREHLPGIVAIENSEAKGASGARNSGAAIAQGRVLAFLDDDAIAQPDWIERLSPCYANPLVVGVGGKINPLWVGSRPFWFPDEFNWVIGCSYKGQPTGNVPVRNVIGANMSVLREVLIRVGGFRESFGNNKDASIAQARSKWLHHQAGDEETEFCIRVTQQAPESMWLYTTSAVVRHHVPVQRTRWSYFIWRCYDEGLGKASLVRLHGTQRGLSSEKVYVFNVLPAGIMRGIADAVLHTKLSGLARAGAIAAGLTMTATGYVVGSFFSRFSDAGNIGVASKRSSSVSQMPPSSVEAR